MAIFSRRSLQRMLDDSASRLSMAQLKDRVRRLDAKNTQQALATEWEVVVLDSLSKLGEVDYEVPLGGRRVPDITFYRDRGEAPLFVADITAVSDHGTHDDNPLDWTQGELWRELRKRGHQVQHFRIDIDRGPATYKGRSGRVKLRIPSKQETRERLFGEDFKLFLSAVRQDPSKTRALEIKGQSATSAEGKAEEQSDVVEPGFALKLIYDPSQRYFGTSYAPFTLPTDARDNTITLALEEKASQLRNSGFDGTMGIILCDADCDNLNNTRPSWEFFNRDELIKRFLAAEDAVQFVLILSAVKPWNGPREIKSFLWMKGVDEEEPPAWVSVVGKIATNFPIPVASSQQARRWREGKGRKEGFSHLGGGKMSYGTEKIKATVSSRVLADLLAGRMTTEEFRGAYKERATGGPSAFEYAVSLGMTIENVSFISDGEASDDDWVEIVFSGPDPAISPFRLP